MSEQFKAGQTVWRITDGVRYEVVAHIGDLVWIRNPGRGNQVFHENSISATDPNQPAEPVPQACPWCSVSEVVVRGVNPAYVGCLNPDCRFASPYRPSRLEAIAAWNSIRVGCVITCAECCDAKADPVTCFCLKCDAELQNTLRGLEREACAQIADIKVFKPIAETTVDCAREIAARIRNRGKP